MSDDAVRYSARIIKADSIDQAIPYSLPDIGSIASRAREYVHDVAASGLEARRQERIQSRTEVIYETRQPELKARFMETATYLNHLKTKNNAQRHLIPKYHVHLLMQGENLTLDQAGMRFVTDGLAKQFAECYERRVFRQYAHESASQEPMTLVERMLGYIAQKTSQADQ